MLYAQIFRATQRMPGFVDWLSKWLLCAGHFMAFYKGGALWCMIESFMDYTSWMAWVVSSSFTVANILGSIVHTALGFFHFVWVSFGAKPIIWLPYAIYGIDWILFFVLIYIICILYSCMKVTIEILTPLKIGSCDAWLFRRLWQICVVQLSIMLYTDIIADDFNILASRDNIFMVIIGWIAFLYDDIIVLSFLTRIRRRSVANTLHPNLSTVCGRPLQPIDTTYDTRTLQLPLSNRNWTDTKMKAWNIVLQKIINEAERRDVLHHRKIGSGDNWFLITAVEIIPTSDAEKMLKLQVTLTVPASVKESDAYYKDLGTRLSQFYYDRARELLNASASSIPRPLNEMKFAEIEEIECVLLFFVISKSK